MGFDILAFLYTIGCCIISMIIAGKSANKENKEWFKNLNHPKNPFILKYMNIIGFGFYILFGYVLYHLLVNNNIVSLIMTIAIIQLMGLSPLLLYKTKHLRIFFITMFIFPILVPILIYLLFQINYILAILVFIYLLCLIYDMNYFYRLMKLNE